MKKTFAVRLALSLSIAAAAAAAHAQYVWLDERGVKQFSDQPPPADVPQKRILKMPGASSWSPSQEEAGNGGETEKAPKTLEERNADFNKRHAEQAEKEKQAAEQAKRDADKAKNCERARQYQSTLASGERIVTRDANGERAFMDDNQRAREMKETRQVLQDCR